MEHHEQDDEQVFPEVRERAVRMVLDNPGRHESRWQAIVSVSAKIGCSANTLNEWVKRAEVDGGERGEGVLDATALGDLVDEGIEADRSVSFERL